MRLRIGIDATSWANPRGYGRFTRELIRELLDHHGNHRFHLFIEQQNAHLLTRMSERAQVVPVRLREVPGEAAGSDSRRSFSDMWSMRRAVLREELDVFFFPTVYSWFPLPRKLKTLLCIHDAIAEKFPQLCFGNRRTRLFWNMKVRAAIWQAHRFLTISEYSRRDLITVLKLDADRIHLTGNAPAQTFQPCSLDEIAVQRTRLGLGPGERWFIYVGGFNPHKNVEGILTSFAALPPRIAQNVKLILVGGGEKDVFHSHEEVLRNLMRRLNLENRVLWTGFLEDEDLAPLLSGAVALVMPSHCEGFGLPAVEAAACGTPVIATTESPLPELLEGGGLFVSSCDQQALTSAMTKMLDDGVRSSMASVALEKARALTWEKSAASTMSALQETAS